MKKINIYSRWDAGILLLTFLVALYLFIQKLRFLSSMWIFEPYWVDIVEVLRANIFVYLAILLWVWLLLNGQHRSWLLRGYVIFSGFVFVTLTRMVEATEEITRQGVDFLIAKHFVLAVFGRQGFAESFFDWVFLYGIFSLLLLGLVLRGYLSIKYKADGGTKLSLPGLLLFLVCVAASFISPQTHSIAKSINQNGLISLIYNAHWPVSDIRRDSNFRFTGISKKHRSHQYKDQFWAIAKGMNVAIITLESTSANTLDFYPGSDGVNGLTPFISKMASHSIFLNEASAVMASTTKSLVSIFCGIEPYPRTEIFEVMLGIPVTCLPKTLEGYDSAYFQTATSAYEGRDLLLKHVGVDKFVSLEALQSLIARPVGVLGWEDKAMLPEHDLWLAERDKPFLALYLTLAQHFPYLPAHPEAEYKQYTDNKSLNDYFNSLSYIDGFIEDLVGQYKKYGLYDNTLFVVVADHGDSFGRYHPVMFHNNVMYREGIWVPFFIFNEKLFPERIEINGQFSLIDVAPTIQYLLGFIPSDEMTGEVVFDLSPQRAVNAACWYVTRCLSRMDEDFKYIYNFGDTPDELYDRKNDFREQHNLARQYPELVDQYRQDLFSWYSDVLSAYESYYEELKPDYRSDPKSYYQFPVY